MEKKATTPPAPGNTPAPGNNDDQGSLVQKNAFQILMAPKKVLPDKLDLNTPRPNRKNDLHNEIIAYLEESNFYFHSQEEGKRVVKLLTDCIWYLDPYIKTMVERFDRFPPEFKRFLNYNNPQAHKHAVAKISKEILGSFLRQIEIILEQPFMNRPSLEMLKINMDMMSLLLNSYIMYLDQKATAIYSRHTQLELPDPTQVVSVLTPRVLRKAAYVKRYVSLNHALNKVSEFEPVCLDDLAPSCVTNRRDRRYYLDFIEEGITVKCIHLKLVRGSNLTTLNFIWKVPAKLDDREDEIMKKNNSLIQKLSEDVPKFHSRALKKNFINSTSLILPDVKTGMLRHIYSMLTGDAAAGQNEEYDERIKLAFDLGDPKILTDLRVHSKGKAPIYEEFFDKVQTYLDSVLETAVDERRMGQVTHMAAAISVTDLLNQVSATCPPETKIPSKQWLRLQFAPKVPSSMSSLQFTGRFNVRFMVQSRQFRKDHEHCHYASALFRYLKDFAIKFKAFTTFVCMDDKHHCKVGEPDLPVAAVERGRRVVTIDGVKFQVADHDFTKFSVVPSVTMLVDIPDSTEGSFYGGQVYVGTKDLVSEPSSPLRHVTELMTVLETEGLTTNPILLLYTDGGPDHRCTYLSVQLSLMCLFDMLDLDMLCAVRTPPYNSWKNPPERVMSVLNLGLQAVGLSRRKMDEVHENAIKGASNLAELRKRATGNEDLAQAMQDSIEPVKILLNSIFQRLSWKQKPLKVFSACNSAHMDQMWHILGMTTDSMKQADLKQALNDFPEVKSKLEHWSVARTYMFALKKCGMPECEICRPPRMAPDDWKNIHILPDPVPGDEGHYKSFEETYGTHTTEEHLPRKNNLQSKKDGGHEVPFSPTAQTAKNVAKVATCVECEKPRVLYAAKKISAMDVQNLKKLLGTWEFSCGASIQDLVTPDNSTPIINEIASRIFIRKNLDCSMPIEIPYYSSKLFVDVCYFCGEKEELIESNGCYPECNDCNKGSDRPPKRKGNIWETKNAKKHKK